MYNKIEERYGYDNTPTNLDFLDDGPSFIDNVTDYTTKAVDAVSKVASDVFTQTEQAFDVTTSDGRYLPEPTTELPEPATDNGLGFWDTMMRQKEYDSLVSLPDAQNEPDKRLTEIREQMVKDESNDEISIPTKPLFGPFVQYDWEAAHKKYPEYQTMDKVVQGIKDRVSDIKPQIEKSGSWGGKMAGSVYGFLADDKNQSVMLASMVAPNFGLVGFVPKVLSAIAENVIGDVAVGGGVVPYAQKMGFEYDYKQQAIDIAVGGTLAPIGIIGTQTLVKKMAGSAKELGKAMNDLKLDGIELEPMQQLHADILSQMDEKVTIAEAMKEMSKLDGDIVDLRSPVEFHKISDDFEPIAMGEVKSPTVPKVATIFDTQINAAAEKHGIPSDLIRAVIQTESNFDPNAKSGVGAGGLMQLMPGTAKDLGVTNVFDANQSIEGGTKYLAQLYKKYDGDIDKTLAAYNWGMGNVDRKGMDAMPKETSDYITKVKNQLSGDVDTPIVAKTDTGDGNVINSIDGKSNPSPDLLEPNEALSYESMLYKSDEELDTVYKDINDTDAIAELNRIDVEASHMDILEKCIIG